MQLITDRKKLKLGVSLDESLNVNLSSHAAATSQVSKLHEYLFKFTRFRKTEFSHSKGWKKGRVTARSVATKAALSFNAFPRNLRRSASANLTIFLFRILEFPFTYHFIPERIKSFGGLPAAAAAAAASRPPPAVPPVAVPPPPPKNSMNFKRSCQYATCSAKLA